MNSHYEAFTGTPLLAVDVIMLFFFYPQTPAVCLLLEKAAL